MFAKADRDTGNQQAVLISLAVMHAHRMHPSRKPLCLELIDDRIAGAVNYGRIDLRACTCGRKNGFQRVEPRRNARRKVFVRNRSCGRMYCSVVPDFCEQHLPADGPMDDGCRTERGRARFLQARPLIRHEDYLCVIRLATQPALERQQRGVVAQIGVDHRVTTRLCAECGGQLLEVQFEQASKLTRKVLLLPLRAAHDQDLMHATPRVAFRPAE